MVSAFGLIQILPGLFGGPTIIAMPGVALLAAGNPVVWFDLIPTLMS